MNYSAIRLSIVALLLGLSFQGLSLVRDTLYIELGTMYLIDGDSVSALSFSQSTEYNQSPQVFQLAPGEELELVLVNNDNRDHQIRITSQGAATTVISPGDSAEVQFSSSSIGAFLLYDDLNNGFNRYLGLSAVIHVKESQPSFYWNLSEHDTTWNGQLAQGQTPDAGSYNPKYWTINGLSTPETMADTLSHVTGAVNETIHIVMTNPGMMKHAMHFHGYHLKILFDNKHPNHVGREKDTFPLETLHCMIVKLVPDKPGIYPVHDHNLMATLGNGNYVNGMVTMLNISE